MVLQHTRLCSNSMCTSHPGSSFFLGKVTALGVLCCFALFVCLILLASFFLPSHLSFKNMYKYSNSEKYVILVAHSVLVPVSGVLGGV